MLTIYFFTFCGFLISIQFFLILISYFLLNLAYSIKLKRIPVLDIAIVSFNYILRITAGGVLINVEISRWIIIVTYSLALFLTLVKRREDVILASRGFEIKKV